VRMLVVIVLPQRLFFFLGYYSFILLSTVIIAEYINNNRDSFININDFNLKEEGANVNKPEDNNSNPIIPMSNTPLGTIIKEDKKGDRPIFSP
jgi:hypothetical protein